jgi:hypothetical protein
MENENPVEQIKEASKLSGLWQKIKTRPKYFGTIAAIAVIIIAAAIFLLPKLFKPEPKSIYSVAVIVRSQTNANTAEDLRSSMKAGDVLVIQSENFGFSATENISYLVLKMSLTESQKQKLTQSEERTLKESELSEPEQKRIEEEKARAKEAGKKYSEPPRRETIQPRMYYIDLAKIGFSDPNVLLSGQPYADKVFDWGIVRKK